jgi:plasmid replication initiation protein
MKLTDGNIIEAFTLFSRYKINKDEQTVEIQVSDYFQYILNDLNIGNFTRYRLKEYTDIKSTYSKAIFQRLKQWKGPGIWEIKIDEFRRLLSIPESYKMGDIDKRILAPALLELTPFFKGLGISKIDKNGKKSGKGRPVRKLVFTFQQQDDSIIKVQPDKYALGKYENVYLTEDEHKKIKMEMKKYYLIEEVSEWKHKRKSQSNNNDYALIMTFNKNKQKKVTEQNHEVAKANAQRKIGAHYDDYKEEEFVDVNGDLFNQLFINTTDNK